VATDTSTTTIGQPTQVDCIVVDKVYDSCSQTITIAQTLSMMPGPSGNGGPPPMMCTVSGCAIDLSSSTCQVGAVTASATTNYSDITFVIGAQYTVTCTSGNTLTETAYTTQTVTLYNPTGTTPSCAIVSGACMCVNLPNGDISCTITLCLLFQTTATVQLLVPTYGFCVPPACGAVGPVVPCPPSPLFPPQENS